MSINKTKRVFIIAGEPSGDQHASRLIRQYIEKNKVQIAPSAIISPCAKFTILVTPYNKESATEAIAIIIPSNKPLPS